MLKLYKYERYISMNGTLSSVFVADSNVIDRLIANKDRVYLSDQLGRWSEIYVYFNDGFLVEITNDQILINFFFEKYWKANNYALICGIDLIGRYLEQANEN